MYSAEWRLLSVALRLARLTLSMTIKRAAISHIEVPKQVVTGLTIWVVVKSMVPFWIPIILRHLVFRYPKRNHNFDNHPYVQEPPIEVA